MPASTRSDYEGAKTELICARKISGFPVATTAETQSWITGFGAKPKEITAMPLL
jgi:hypothetical protein